MLFFYRPQSSSFFISSLISALSLIVLKIKTLGKYTRKEEHDKKGDVSASKKETK